MRIEILENPKHPLRYLYQTDEGYPKRIYWKIIAGPELLEIQMNDAIFDKYDLKIRKLV